MARTPKDVTDAELRVLQALWELGPSTIRQLTDRLHPGGGPARYATVQVLLKLVTPPLLTVRIPWMDATLSSGPDVSSPRSADLSLPTPVPQAEQEVAILDPAEDAKGAVDEPAPEVAPLSPSTRTSEAPPTATPGERPPERSAWMVAGVALWLAGTLAWTVLAL